MHHPIFLWVQRVTPKRASVIGAPPGRTQAPLPPIGQISVLEKSRLALNLPHTRFVSYCRKHSADVHPHACRGHPPDPNAAFGRNFLAIVPKGQPKNRLAAVSAETENRVRRIHRTRFVRYCLRKSACPSGSAKLPNPIRKSEMTKTGQVHPHCPIRFPERYHRRQGFASASPAIPKNFFNPDSFCPGYLIPSASPPRNRNEQVKRNATNSLGRQERPL